MKRPYFSASLHLKPFSRTFAKRIHIHREPQQLHAELEFSHLQPLNQVFLNMIHSIFSSRLLYSSYCKALLQYLSPNDVEPFMIYSFQLVRISISKQHFNCSFGHCFCHISVHFELFTSPLDCFCSVLIGGGFARFL